MTLAVLHICAAPSAQAQTNFQATPGNCEIVLQWIGSASSTGYNLSRATSLDGPYVQLAANYQDTQYNDASTGQPIFAYTDTELTNGTAYYYQVSAAGSGATQSTSTSPNGPPGWVQQHRKDVFGSITGSSDYDLTGLSAIGYYRNGQTSPSVQVYLGTDNSLDVILQYLPDADTFGEKVEGTSTYTWEWFPPANPTGLHNDPSKTVTDPSQPFPAPKLYVITAADPFISANPQSDSMYFKATGSVKDGLTSNWNPTLSITGGPGAQPVQVPDNSQLPRHGILTATPGASSQKVDAKISPFAQLSLTNPGAASGEIYLDISTYPLLLDLPNAFVRPDLWDSNADSSNNRFLYSGDTPAILDVPARISTGNDPFTDDLDWLINTGKAPKVTWLFDAVPAQNPSMTPLTDTNGSSTYLGDLLKGKAAGIIPTTVDASNNPVLQFLGLPSSITGFGNHTITLGVQKDSASSSYSQSQTAYIQTFFPGVKSNYPGAPADQANLGYATPNWYYYYNQVFPTRGASGEYDARYSPDTGISFTQYDDSNPQQPTGHIQLKNDAYQAANGLPYTMHVFDISPNPDPKDGNHYVRCVGTLQMYGIMSYIYLAAHEQGHVDTMKTFVTVTDPVSGRSYNNPIDTTNIAATGDPYLPASSDGDNIWDAWESQHHMMSGKPDTTHAYGVLTNGDVADNEVVADIDAFEHVFAQVDAGAWRLDWADQGLNAQPYFVQEPYNNQPNNFGKAPTFYIKFVPKGGVTPYPNQAGIQPVVTKDGFYEIRNMQDLRNLYPNLVTNLGQM